MAERTQKTNVTWPRRPPQEAGWLLEKPELWGSEPMGRAEKASRRKAGSKARAEVDSAVSMRQRREECPDRRNSACGTPETGGETRSV